MQRLPELVDAETGHHALLARLASGRGDEDLVMTRAGDSRVWDADGREYIDCTTQDGFDDLVGARAPERTKLRAKSTCASRASPPRRTSPVDEGSASPPAAAAGFEARPGLQFPRIVDIPPCDVAVALPPQPTPVARAFAEVAAATGSAPSLRRHSSRAQFISGSAQSLRKTHFRDLRALFSLRRSNRRLAMLTQRTHELREVSQ
jgi:hypothetical protein